MDLVHDVLRKRKQSDPVGWQPFAKHLKHINLPVELVGNVNRRQYMQQTTHGSSPRWSDRVRRQAVRSLTNGSRRRQAPSSDVPIKWDWCRILAQSRHDRRWVSIDYRRGRSKRVSHILCNRACFKTSS